MLVYREGLLDLRRLVVQVMIPFYKTGDVAITARLAPSGVPIPIDWTPGSIIFVPGRADLIMTGTGVLVLLCVNFANIHYEDQRGLSPTKHPSGAGTKPEFD